MGFGKSKNESDQQGQFTQGVWGGQTPFLQNLYRQAGDVMAGTLANMNPMQWEVQGSMRDVFRNMQQPWQQQLQGGAYSGVDPNRILGSLEASIGTPSQTGQLYKNIMGGQGNVYLGGMEDILQRQSEKRQGQALRGLDQRAAAANMGGSSSYRNLQGDIISDEADRLAEQQTGLGFSTFSPDLALKMGIAEQADANTLARQQMMVDMLGGKQAAMSGGLGFGQNMYQMPMGRYATTMMPWQAMNQYANVIGRPTVLGSGASSGQASGKGFGLGF